MPITSANFGIGVGVLVCAYSGDAGVSNTFVDVFWNALVRGIGGIPIT